MTDNELIRGIRENSSTAWREIYFRNSAKLRPKISQILQGVKDLTFEDVFEEALLSLMENVKESKLSESESTNLSGYLYTLCWRIAVHKVAKAKREEAKLRAEVKDRKESNPDWEEDSEDPSVEPEEYSEAMEFLQRVMDSMPPQCKSILKRFYWDRLPMSQIAAMHGLKNENTAKTTKSRCMEKFKKLASAMLSDDEKAESAVRRTVERNALRDLLNEFRREESGDLAMAALKTKDKKDKDKDNGKEK